MRDERIGGIDSSRDGRIGILGSLDERLASIGTLWSLEGRIGNLGSLDESLKIVALSAHPHPSPSLEHFIEDNRTLDIGEHEGARATQLDSEKPCLVGEILRLCGLQ